MKRFYYRKDGTVGMKFTTLAFNPLSRMSEIYRYSSTYQEDVESLAEHVTEVSIMSYFIARTMNAELKEGLDIGRLLEKCLVHDMDEVLTGDVPRNTKYATNSVHVELNKVADEAVDLIEGFLGVDITDQWKTAKEGKEGVILKISDMLCVAKKAIMEIELRGNLSFLKVVEELETHLEKMTNAPAILSEFANEDSQKFLKNLITEALNEIVTIRVKHQHVIDKFYIKENVIKGE